ncbi:right-handed parallel beta-helix repeat-containing protein [Microbacterium testaceum]|uniref:right-handed parallel beta-helix repeat-containing protein n=1 Tax=Microbacterium testaceum TaxID=2033 RepID=UPI0013053DFA|nr:right-handed parallel beta-helix repeat-containing protein [Microbacterium testaceum]
MVQEDSGRITYGPDAWQELTNPNDLGGTSRFRTTPGWAEIQFTGSAIEWIGRKSPRSGIARVLIDGAETERVDRYAAADQYQQQLLGPASDPAGFGTHTLRIEWTSDANASTSAVRSIHVDAFKVLDFSALEGQPISLVTPAQSDTYAKRSGVTVSWPKADSAVKYNVYRSSSGQPRALARVVGGSNNTAWLDSGLEFGRSYQYDVTAVSKDGTESQPSSRVSYQQPYLQPRATDVSECPAPTVTVTDTASATAAIASAQPGTTIRLADGVYGPLVVNDKHGTAEQRISICGTRDAIIRPFPDTFNMVDGIGVRVQGSSFITLNGFTIQNAQKGVALASTSDSRVYGLRVTNTSQGGIYAQTGSSDNLIAANQISHTGLDESIPKGGIWHQDGRYGEGIYVGNSQGNDTCEPNCAPDASDRNVIIWNTITDVTAEGIEAKEQSTGGLIYNNTVAFSSTHQAAIYSALQIKGDGYLVYRNNITSGLKYGIRSVTTQVGDRDWGYDNVFASNTITLTSEIDPAEYGFLQNYGTANVFGCDNTLDSSPSVPLVASPTVCEP